MVGAAGRHQAACPTRGSFQRAEITHFVSTSFDDETPALITLFASAVL